MHPKTIFAKTPKGVLEVKNKTTKLPREIGVVFLSVDGKSTLTDLAKKAGMDEKVLTAALQKLTTDGFIKVFSSPDMTAAAPAAPATAASIAQAARAPAGGDDLDFTSPAAMAKLNTEAVNRTKAEAEAKARALAAAKAAAEAKVRQEAETRARTQAEAKAKVEAEGKVRAEAAAKAAAEARTKAEAEVKAAAGAQARAEAEGRIKAAMEAKARADAEAKARHEAEMRATQEAETKAASEAKAKEEADTRARAETEARALAEAETRAKTAVEAQMKALTDALGEAQRRARQEAEARVRVEAEIKSRQEAERRARAEVEARAKAAEDAVVEARKYAEEAARAKAHVESKAVMEAMMAGGGDSARAHMESTLKALEEAKTKARTEAEARVDAEKRAKAEAEARAREEQERAERELKERKERDEADQRTRAQLRELQEQARHATQEAEAKAAVERKGREEAEARVETERKAREEAERKAADEAKAREETFAKMKAEAETKARAEVEALIQAERKAREEAEQRAQQEIAAKLEAEKRARAEAERQTEIARKARDEAERKSKESGGDSQAALRARAEAEIIARKAEEAVAQARAQADTERKARALAEDRAKTEAVARVMQEQQLRAGAEDQIKARVQEEIKARERAEMEAEARYRQEQAARAKASADERRKRDEEAKATGKPIRRAVRSNTNWPLTIGVVFVVALAIAIGLLHVVPLNNYIGPVQDLMSKRLGVPVTITNLRYALFPAPQLTLHRVGIGKLQEVKVDSIVVSAWPMALFGENKRFDTAVLHTVTADQDALGMVPAWIKAQAGVLPVDLRRVELRAVKLAVKEIEVPPFNGDITFGPDGALQRAVLSTGKVKVDLTPRDRGFRAVLEASDYRLPLGPAVEFNDLVMEGTIEPQQAAITAISGKIGLRGVIKGSARASWGEGPIRVEGDFSIANGDLGPLLSDFTRDFTATGTLHANITYAAQSQKLQSLFAQPAVEATFNIEKGVINNVDIVRAIQSPVREGLRGGKTGFNTLAGSMRLANQSFSYRQLQLSSGPMRASGNVDIGANGELSGRISAELGSKSVIVARGNLAVTGNLKTPVLK